MFTKERSGSRSQRPGHEHWSLGFDSLDDCSVGLDCQKGSHLKLTIAVEFLVAVNQKVNSFAELHLGKRY